jgi:curved DNA-binding protein CbpA
LRTLYDLLGALPQDDADSLRTAFRKAAKTCHPDNNPGDPGAAQRFARIVRAYSILRDETKRASYDSWLSEAEQERAAYSRRNVFSGLPGPLSSMVIASVSIGAFVGLERTLTIPDIPRWREISARVSALTAAMPTLASSTVGRAGEHAKSESDKEPDKKSDKILPAEKQAISDAIEETTASIAVATADPRIAIPANAEPSSISEPPSIYEPVKDASYYRERGSLAYRSGDFPLALTDFDLAINLDPNFSDAYVNRAIVFRRLGDLKRALADVSQARRIDERKRP